jgi:hypothetical protein
MLQDWEFDIEQAISMLSVLFCANDIYSVGVAKDRCNDIRKRAVEVLDKVHTDTIERILLQLTQAYR